MQGRSVAWFRKTQHTKAWQQTPPTSTQQSDHITLSGVHLRRGQHDVLKGLNLHWHEKKVGLIGNNGSGKSSLIRLLNGLLLPDQGQVEVFGYNTQQQPEVLPSLVGFIFQNPDHQLIFPTVAEELAFGCEQLGDSPHTAREKALNLLSQYSMQDWANRPVSELSEGQKQKVCILAILIMEPKLLVLDEPFSALDLPTRLQLMALLEQSDCHLLLISHDFSVYEQFDRLIWLDAGQIRADGQPADVIEAYRNAVTQERA